MNAAVIATAVWSAAVAVEVLTTGGSRIELITGLAIMPAFCLALRWITTRPT